MRKIISSQRGLIIRVFIFSIFVGIAIAGIYYLQKYERITVNIYKDMEQIITHLEKILRKYPVLSLIVVVVLGVLLFLSSIEAGRSIGDAIWG